MTQYDECADYEKLWEAHERYNSRINYHDNPELLGKIQRSEQRCKFTYYAASCISCLYEIRWDEDGQILMYTGDDYEIIRTPDIKGDLTLQNVLDLTGFGSSHFVLETCLDETYKDKLMDYFLTETIRKMPIIHFSIYRNIDVYNSI